MPAAAASEPIVVSKVARPGPLRWTHAELSKSFAHSSAVHVTARPRFKPAFFCPFGPVSVPSEIGEGLSGSLGPVQSAQKSAVAA